MLIWFRSQFFFVVFIAHTVLISILTLLMFPFPSHWRYPLLKAWAGFNLFSLKWICNLDYRIEGLEHLPKAEEKVIILSKHQSAWEIIAFYLFFPPSLAWVAKRELLWIPIFGWAFAIYQPIAIDRKAGRKAIAAVINQGLNYLNQGRWVVIFPEGTRVKPGQPTKYLAGGALLAQRAGSIVLPVALNSGKFWSRQSWLKRPGVVTVRIGPIIQTKGRKAQQILADTENWIETQMQEIG